VFGIEASFPESIAVNDYVLEGKGDPKKAVFGMGFWTWCTEEVLDQIEWMRKWNADAKHSKKVKFLGFDMQTARGGVARVLDYLAKVDARTRKVAAVSLAPLDEDNERTYAALPSDKQAETAKAISELVDSFDKNKRAWSSRTSPSAWAMARQNAVVVSQTEHQLSSPKDQNWRDESMAKNAQWMLDQEPPGARAMLWAHNGHVGRTATWFQPMGAVLSRALGKDYVSLGFVFDRGGFQAISGPDQRHQSIREQNVGEVGPGDVAEAFHRSGKAMCALDLRSLPPGPVEAWWSAPHFMRQKGAMFVDEASMSTVVVLPLRFDAVIFVDQTTHSRLLSAPL
jgi:erythromycin esterase